MKPYRILRLVGSLAYFVGFVGLVLFGASLLFGVIVAVGLLVGWRMDMLGGYFAFVLVLWSIPTGIAAMLLLGFSQLVDLLLELQARQVTIQAGLNNLNEPHFLTPRPNPPQPKPPAVRIIT